MSAAAPRPLTAATLFSGIGAPEAAMPSWHWLWHAEVAKFPSAVMATRQPHSVNLGDVTADDFFARAVAIGRPDVLVFGSPCQSYSVAGKRLGLDDPRGNLALVALGLVDRLRPRWFCFENVPGLYSSWSGGPDGDAGWTERCHDSIWRLDREFTESSDFAAFLHAVADIGYQCAWTLLDAQFAGVAQRRERLFVVGHARDWRGPAAVLLEPESLCGHPPARGEARQDLTGTLTGRATGGSVGNTFDLEGGLVPDVANVLTQRMHKGINTTLDEGQTLIAHALRAEGFDASEDGTGRGTPLVPVLAATLKSNNGGGGFGSDPSETFVPVAFTAKDHGADAGEIAPTLRSGNHDRSHANGGVMPAIAFATSGLDSPRDDGTTPPIKANLNGQGTGGGPSVFASVGSAVRRLTPRECERLQGFPDDYTVVSYRNKPAARATRRSATAWPCR